MINDLPRGVVRPIPLYMDVDVIGNTSNYKQKLTWEMIRKLAGSCEQRSAPMPLQPQVGFIFQFAE